MVGKSFVSNSDALPVQNAQHIAAVVRDKSHTAEPPHQRKKRTLFWPEPSLWRFALNRQQAAILHHPDKVRAATPAEPDKPPAHFRGSGVLAFHPCDGGVIPQRLQHFNQRSGFWPVICARDRCDFMAEQVPLVASLPV